MNKALKEFESNLAYYFSELSEKPLAKPLWVYISLSHKCTYNCQMCGVVKILKDYELSTEIIKKAFDEIAGWGRDFTIVITGGEPFLRQDIFEIFKYAKKLNLKIEVVSNGSLIDREIADRVMVSGLQNIAISIDGAIDGTHDFIRQKGAFKKAVEAVRTLATAKKDNGSGPQISAWTTIMRENVRELSDIILLAENLGVECLVYHPVIVVQDDMQNTSSQARFWLRDGDVDELKKQIDKIVSYQEKNGLVAFLHNPYLWVEHFRGGLTRKDWKCNPFVFINIGPDGEMRSCGSSFGNIHKMSLTDCLNTPEAYSSRKVMKDCQKPCLQTCWANPESDSLIVIVDRLIGDIKKDNIDKSQKKKLLAEALSKLTAYEELIK